MSSIDIAIAAMRKLESVDFRVLSSLEVRMGLRRFVPLREIAKLSDIPENQASYHVSELHRLGLLMRRSGDYLGYTMNSAGYDCLALHALVQAGVIDALGKPLGVGKEADVYDALSPDGERLAVKFHRIGRTSFRDVKRKRAVEEGAHSLWLFRSRRAAERELEGMTRAYAAGVATPRPVRQNRHALVMSVIEGSLLADAAAIESPRKTLDEIVANIRLAYGVAGIIHGDLSEYNIIMKTDTHILLIDWPQFVASDHPNAEELLQRDLRNVCTFFHRRYGVTRSWKRVKSEIMKSATVSSPQPAEDR